MIPAIQSKSKPPAASMRFIEGRFIQCAASKALTVLRLRFHWAISLMFVLQGQLLEAQSTPQQAHVTSVNPTLASANATNTSAIHAAASAQHQPDSSHIHEIWFFYLSSIAITITAGSTLLVALAIVKLQSIAVSLSAIERSLAETFHRIDKLDEYLQQTSEHSLNECWGRYFKAVDALSRAHSSVFPTRGRYNETQVYVTTLVQQGRNLEERNHALQTKMPPVFVATAIVAGLALLGLPAVQWVTQTTLIVVWVVSGISCLALLVFFLHVINSAFKGK